MTDGSLSQDEIEALLSDAGDRDDLGTGSDAPRVRAFDLGAERRSIRQPIPTLDLVCARFARAMRQAIAGFARTSVSIEQASTTVSTYEEFLAGLRERSTIDVLRLRPLQGSAVLALDPTLVLATVEALFGGDPDSAAESPPREFTRTEQRIVDRLVEQACIEYGSAWQGMHPIVLEPLRSETSPAMARIVAASDTVIVTRLALRVGRTPGTLHLCIPYAAFEPIRETLYATVQAGEGQEERRWTRQLADRIQSAEVNLVAEFAHATATIEELMSLKVGDFIEIVLQETITAKVDDFPVFQCRYGVSNGRYALRIQSYLTTAGNPPDDQHDR